MSNSAGLTPATGARVSAGAGSSADAAAKRSPSTTPSALAAADAVAENLTETDIDAELLRDPPDRWDDDDFPDEESAPDLGEPDDDEPPLEPDDERPAVLPARPGISFWMDSRGQIGWEVRPIAISALADDDLAALAEQEQRALRRVAGGIAGDLLAGIDLRADLALVWDGLPVETPTPREDVTQASLERRWGTGPTFLSKRHDLLVGLPRARAVPLSFFTWKSPPGGRMPMSADAMVRQIAGWDDLETLSKADVNRRFPRLNSDYAGTLFYWVRAVRAHPRVVARHRSRFDAFPQRYRQILDDLGAELIAAEQARASADGLKPFTLAERQKLPVLYRALVGGIE